MAGAPQTEYDALCGVAVPGGCVPDDVNACLTAMGGQSGRAGGGGSSGSGGATSGSGGSGGSGDPAGAGEAGAGGEGGVGQAGSAPQGGESSSGRGGSSGAGAGAASGTGATSGSAGSSGAGMDGGLPRYSCQVGVRRSEPQASCVLAGPGTVDSPCLRGSDCQPGLACVGKVAGRCRPYCCDHTACRSVEDTHCAEEPLLGVPASGGVPRTAPVCVPAVECSLAEDYPCASNTCTCPDDTACMVVSEDGKTSCVVPGDGGAGEACPCKWGHVCSQATNECVKLCQTAAPGDDCGSGRCQATPALPLGWGVCVGFVPQDAG
jgi:hypothetical protein